jgi:hypothetical protein
MATELRWIANLPASAMHAAQAILNQQGLTDANLAAVLAAPTRRLETEIAEFPLRPDQVLPQLIALAAGISQPQELAEVTLAKLLPRKQFQNRESRLVEAIRETIAVFNKAVPDVLEELTVRSGPIRNQWDARGPGLLAAMRRLTSPDFIVDRADVVLLYPVLGGDGCAFAQYNTVAMEAVLADPVPGLPEMVRLAWLLAQLNSDLPGVQGQINALNAVRGPRTRDRLEELVAFATLPLVLAAAEEVELASCGSKQIELALQSWYQRRTDCIEIPADLLFNWWTTYQRSGSNWHIAIAALIQMKREFDARGG